MDGKMPPGIPQMSYKLKTASEWIENPTDATILSYLQEVIGMLNFTINDDGYEKLNNNQKKLFKKRDDIYYDEQHKTYFLKEDKLK